MTEWRDIPNYPGYRVSSDGRIQSKRFPDRDLRQTSMRFGHKRVTLFNESGRRLAFVHTLMLEAFVGPRPEWAHLVRHLNDISADNRLENLAYGTHADNSADAVRNGVHNNTRKTHCAKGHPFSEENTYREGRKRHCVICRQINQEAYNARRRKPPKDPNVDYTPHGTPTGYINHGCRCAACSEARRAYRFELRARARARRDAELHDQAVRRHLA